MKLYIGNQDTGISVQPDDRYPDMWRICKGEKRSGMVNLTRAKDAAITWARPRGLGGQEIPSWRSRETRWRAALVRERDDHG